MHQMPIRFDGMGTFMVSIDCYARCCSDELVSFFAGMGVKFKPTCSVHEPARICLTVAQLERFSSWIKEYNLDVKIEEVERHIIFKRS